MKLLQLTVLRLSGFCLGRPGWAGTRRHSPTHPLALETAVKLRWGSDGYHVRCRAWVCKSIRLLRFSS